MGTKPTQLFSLMSTKYATVIVIASSYRFKCRSHNWMVKCMTKKNANIAFYRKADNFQMVIIVSRTSHISYKQVSTEN